MEEKNCTKRDLDKELEDLLANASQQISPELQKYIDEAARYTDKPQTDVEIFCSSRGTNDAYPL